MSRPTSRPSALSRRTFLKSALTASAAAAFPSIIPATALGKGGRPAPSSRVVMGVIGLGMGWHDMVPLMADPRVQMVALADLVQDRIDKCVDTIRKSYGANATVTTTKDKFELINRDDLDALVIALPDHWHAIPVIAAAKRRKHLYAEKPLCLTIPEGRAMVNAVQRYGVTCQVGSQQRSSGEFRRVVELVRGGALGDVKRIEVGLPAGAGGTPNVLPVTPPPAGFDYERWLGPAPWAPYQEGRCLGNWRWNLDYSGGQLTDWIQHHCDIAMWAMGVSRTGVRRITDARAKFAEGPLYNTAYEYEFNAHFDGGLVIRVGSNPIVAPGVKFIGSAGWAHVDRGTQEFSSSAIRNAVVPADAVPLLPAGGHHRNFIDCIYSGAETVAPIHEALRVVTVAHLANAAFRSGVTSLDWDPVQERVLNSPDAARFLSRPYRSPWKIEA